MAEIRLIRVIRVRSILPITYHYSFHKSHTRWHPPHDKIILQPIALPHGRSLLAAIGAGTDAQIQSQLYVVGKELL